MALIEAYVEELVVGLYDIGEIGFVQPPASDIAVVNPDYPEEVFKKLKSGRMSPHYFNGRNVTGFNKGSEVPVDRQQRILDSVVDSTCELLNEMEVQQPFDHIAGLPLAMTSIAAMVALRRGDSLLWLRPF